MDCFGGEIGSAIERHEVMAVEEDERFEGFAALESAKDADEGGAELAGFDVVENGSHLRVARNALQMEEGLEIPLVALASIVERQEGRRLESEEREAGHQRIAEGNLGGIGPLIGHRVEIVADESKEGVGREMQSLRRVKIHGKSLCSREDGGAREAASPKRLRRARSESSKIKRYFTVRESLVLHLKTEEPEIFIG